jgi:glutaredoxin 3
MEPDVTGAKTRPSITVYTTEPCARCNRAKDLLRRHDLLFEEVNLAKDPAGRRELVAFTGEMTFPQIVIGREPVGGLAQLEEAAASGRLEQLVLSPRT